MENIKSGLLKTKIECYSISNNKKKYILNNDYMSKTIEIILNCGVGEKYANEVVDVYDCISLQLTGKKIGKGSVLLAISLENPPKG